MESSIDYRKMLLDNTHRIAIWGSGYIGFTTGINYAINGVKALCFDTDQEVVDTINSGKIKIPNLEYWLGFPVSSLVENGLLSATSDLHQMMQDDIIVHFLAIPTEKAGEPWNGPLLQVLDWIAKRPRSHGIPDLLIIESTLTPSDIDKLVLPRIKSLHLDLGTDIFIGLAPRRDWFHSPEKNLKNLPRVFAGTDSISTKHLQEVLSIVCDRLIAASSHRVAELVKPVENSLLHIPVVYAMQLARAYPGIDIGEVLKLAATHWRIPLYFPSVGTGGYCIPVSSKYVLYGAPDPDQLSLPKAALAFDADQPHFIAQKLIQEHVTQVGLLGICYKGDLKVHTLSPSLSIVRYLKEQNVSVKVHDPYYSDEELAAIVKTEPLRYPDGLSECDAVIVVPDHRIYTQTPKSILLQSLRKGTIVYDNVGVWEKHGKDLRNRGIRYARIGDINWLSP